MVVLPACSRSPLLSYLGEPNLFGVVSRQCSEKVLALAFRRIDAVRITVGQPGTQAEVYGIGHRFPATVPVSLSLAARLVQSGVPLEIQVEDGSQVATAAKS